MKARNENLQLWFGLSYATFLTLPRAFMESMPNEWQEKMAELLFDYDETFIKMPEAIGTRVQITKNGKLTETPDYIKDYRDPDTNKIESFKGR